MGGYPAQAVCVSKADPAASSGLFPLRTQLESTVKAEGAFLGVRVDWLWAPPEQTRKASGPLTPLLRSCLSL